jgi:hypothetical protein
MFNYKFIKSLRLKFYDCLKKLDFTLDKFIFQLLNLIIKKISPYFLSIAGLILVFSRITAIYPLGIIDSLIIIYISLVFLIMLMLCTFLVKFIDDIIPIKGYSYFFIKLGLFGLMVLSMYLIISNFIVLIYCFMDILKNNRSNVKGLNYLNKGKNVLSKEKKIHKDIKEKASEMKNKVLDAQNKQFSGNNLNDNTSNPLFKRK